ncbi:dehydrogenase [Thiomicrorhabdus immobilis]|uniref:Dehydrogenase n=1 Tax=Thiomicrorhabdus immobilis TaxID=2791037 RepID=A0ABN6CVW1_9GAMM|nr:NAD(P)H-dependent oxidoreductase [Thiomicrorhabdus immobilis]BCN93202.1 dehydrogenase [Thiomicrorhabdus immobilis]
MSKKILIIQGHPDSTTEHLGHFLVKAYTEGAQQAGHQVKLIEVAKLNFSLLSSEQEFENQPPVSDIQDAQDKILWAEHIIVFYPLWLGDMPAILKGFWEQVLRPGFAMTTGDRNSWPQKRLKGRSAHIVVTMGMPAFIYRWFYCAHSLKNLKRNILSFCGISPIKHTLIGSIENLNTKQRNRLMDKMRTFGQKAQ